MEVSELKGEKVLAYSHLLLPHRRGGSSPRARVRLSRHGRLARERALGRRPWPVLQGYQRHLLQLEYTDRQLGRPSAGSSAGAWDSALVVVVADHGVSFRAGEGRRPVTADNLADIVNVPMFVKLPGQRRGRGRPAARSTSCRRSPRSSGSGSRGRRTERRSRRPSSGTSSSTCAEAR